MWIYMARASDGYRAGHLRELMERQFRKPHERYGCVEKIACLN